MRQAAVAQSFAQELASGAWLSPSAARFAAWAMSAGTVISLALLFLHSHGLLDYAGRPLGTDFSCFWSAGLMALQGQAPQAYDWNALFAVQHQIFGTEKLSPWSYPPLFLLLASLFATMPYLVAYFAWQGASLAVAGFAYWKILPFRSALLFGFGFPAVLICLGHGQNGFLTAALMAGGLLALRRQEILAGVLFGLLAYKPQFGLLLPLALAVRGYWRAFAAAAATVVATIGVTLLIWGWPVWQAFFDSLPLTRGIVLEAGDTGFQKLQSIFAWVRLWHGSVTLGYALQTIVAIGVTVATIWIWRSRVSFSLQAAALILGSLLVSPYMFDYDFVVFGMALAFLFAHGLQNGFRPWDRTLIAFAWFMPVLARTVAKTAYLPIGFLTLAAIFVLIVLRAREEQAVR
ncbi:MAG TPA: glycosyltransferase family 87 protein [Xanthobacteraceae bacterium]|nr:glycosyltransferase family 87 protein [Xanthobacteraceae bacterium]